MTTFVIRPDRSLSSTADSVGSDIGRTRRPAEVPTVGGVVSDAGFRDALLTFLGRPNTICIGGHELTLDMMTAALRTETMVGRQAALRDALNIPTLDYDDFRRLIDDIMQHSPAATGLRFSISMDDAVSVGVVESTISTDVDYGARRTRLEVQTSLLSPSATVAAPEAVGGSAVSLYLANTLRNPTVLRDATALIASPVEPGPSYASVVDTLRASRLPTSVASVLLRNCTAGAQARDTDLVAAYGRIASDPTFLSLSESEQQQFLAIVRLTGPEARTVSALLLERQVDGHSILSDCSLVTDAAHGDTLLDQLSRLADAPIHPSIAGLMPRGALVAGVLTGILNPERIDQSIVGSCTVTSAQYSHATRHPADYARIVIDLMETGSATLATGRNLHLEPAAAHGFDTAARVAHEGVVSPSAFGVDRRDAVERVFQTALERLEDPAYAPRTDTTIDATGARVLGGLYPTDLARVETSLEGRRVLSHNAAAGLALLTAHPERLASVTFDLWANEGDDPSDTGAHHVSFVGFAPNGDVILRNPQGAWEFGEDIAGDPTHGLVAGPPTRIVTRDESGMFSMSQADFLALASTVNVAEDTL